MPHRFFHVVALHRVYRDGNGGAASHVRLGPTLLLVVEKKRHERLERQRTVEDRSRQKEALQHRIIVPKTSKEFFAAFRRQYLFYLLLGADFDEPIFQNRATHGRTGLEILKGKIFRISHFPLPSSLFPLPYSLSQPFRLQIHNSIRERAKPAQRIFRRLGYLFAHVF